MENQSYPSRSSSGILAAVLKRRGLLLGIILLVALLGFEMFNFSTTQYALNDLLGEMRFAGIRWATILAIAFCGIDFAGIARLFTSDETESTGREVWFLFIAWLLAATLNATLTWWGVSMALVNHPLASTSVVDPGILIKIVPIFVSIVVWVTRILVISAISSEGARLLQLQNQLTDTEWTYQRTMQVQNRPISRTTQPSNLQQTGQTSREVQPRPISRITQPQNNIPRPSVATPAAPAIPVRPAPRPIPKTLPAAQEEVEDIDEPEYIPDPSYNPAQPAFHRLNARSQGNNTHERH